MLALGIIILILILILILPVGADAAYAEEVFSLALKVGPFRIRILPAKPEDEKGKKPKKEKKPKKKKDTSERDKKKKGKSKLKLSFDDIMSIVRIGLNALGRFWRSISIDLLKLHLVVAASDPYDAVMNYGHINAALGALLPIVHRVFKIKDEDYASDIDFQTEKMKINARAVLTVRIGEILLILLCAAFAFVRWLIGFRRKNKAMAKAEAEKAKAKTANEKITENSSAQKGN